MKKANLYDFLIGIILMFLTRMLSATIMHSIVYIGTLSLFTLIGIVKPKSKTILITTPLIVIDLILFLQNHSLFPFIFPVEFLLAILGIFIGKKIALSPKYHYKILLVCLFISLNSIFYWGTAHIEYHQKIQEGYLGTISSDFLLVDYNNKEINASDVKGKIIFIDLWTTYCSICIKNFSNIEQIYNHYSSHPNVLIWSINTGTHPDTYARFKKFMTAKKLNTELFLYDKNSQLSNVLAMDEKGVPQHFIIKDGSILWLHQGITNDEFSIFSNKVIAQIDKILQENNKN